MSRFITDAPRPTSIVTALRQQVSRFPTTKQARAYYWPALRKWVGTPLKEATAGGDQEASFEQSFSSLAYTYLRDKAPQLLDSLVGFQMLDRADDNRKAAAVFGFKLGNQWIYVPIFFLNGEIRGHEMMLLKNQDLFVPLKEGWINYVLARKPHMLGSQTAKDTFQLGGMWPDLRALTNPYRGSKYASALPAVEKWAEDFLVTLARTVTSDPFEDPRYTGTRDLPTIINESFPMLKRAMSWVEEYPALRLECYRFYGPDVFTKALAKHASDFEQREKQAEANEWTLLSGTPPKTAIARPQQYLLPDDDLSVHPIKRGALEVRLDPELVITHNRPTRTLLEATTRLENGVFVNDKRRPEDKTIVYNTQVPYALTNPIGSGIYQLLVKPGEYARCFVSKQPFSGRGQEHFCTAVRLDSGENKSWINTDGTSLWVRETMSDESFHEWFDKLSDSKEMSEDSKYILIGRDGSSSVPFEVRDNLGDGKYEVDYDDYARRSDLAHWVRTNYRDPGLGEYPGYKSHSAILHLNARQGTRWKAIGGELYAPETIKVLKVRQSRKDRDGELAEPGVSNPAPLQPGNMADVQLQIYQKTASLKVTRAHDEFLLDVANLQQRRLPGKMAFVSLIRDFGTSEEDARLILKEATTKGSVRFRAVFPAWVKAGMGPGGWLTNQGPSAPPVPPPEVGSDLMFGGASSIYPSEDLQEVPGLEAHLTDPYIYDPLRPHDPNATQVANTAAQTGQKEVFDTAAVSSLMKTVEQDNVIDRYLGDIMKGNDRIARTLLNFYWHMDELKEQTGSADVPDLLDAMRNTFDSNGDVILELRELSQDPHANDFASPDMEALANT